MKNLKNWLNRNGFKFEESKNAEGKEIIFIHVSIDNAKDTKRIRTYLKRYKFNFEYRANYTIISVIKIEQVEQPEIKINDLLVETAQNNTNNIETTGDNTMIKLNKSDINDYIEILEFLINKHNANELDIDGSEVRLFRDNKKCQDSDICTSRKLNHEELKMLYDEIYNNFSNLKITILTYNFEYEPKQENKNMEVENMNNNNFKTVPEVAKEIRSQFFTDFNIYLRRYREAKENNDTNTYMLYSNILNRLESYYNAKLAHVEVGEENGKTYHNTKVMEINYNTLNIVKFKWETIEINNRIKEEFDPGIAAENTKANTLESYINTNLTENKNDYNYNESFCNIVIDYFGSYEPTIQDVYFLNSNHYDIYDFLDDDEESDKEIIQRLENEIELDKLNTFLKLPDAAKRELTIKTIDNTFNKIRQYNPDNFINLNYMNELYNYEFKSSIDLLDPTAYTTFKNIFEYCLFYQLQELNLTIDNDNYNKIIYDSIYSILAHINIRDYFNNIYHVTINNSVTA